MFFYSTWGVRIMIIDKYVPILSNISGFSPCDNRKSPTSKWAVRNTQDFLRRLVTARRDRWRLCSSDDQVCVYARDARTQWRATTRLSAKLRVVNALLCGNDVVEETCVYISSKFINHWSKHRKFFLYRFYPYRRNCCISWEERRVSNTWKYIITRNVHTHTELNLMIHVAKICQTISIRKTNKLNFIKFYTIKTIER